MKEKIKKIVKEKFNEQVVAIKRITEGYSHFMFDVRIDKFPFEVIIRFSNEDEARRWYHSPEYQSLLKHRLQASKGTVLLINDRSAE